MRRVILVLGVLAACCSPSAGRTWKDATGRHSTEADLVKVQGRFALLRKTNGKTVAVRVDRLSKPDRKYVDAWLASNNEVQQRRLEPPGQGRNVGDPYPIAVNVDVDEKLFLLHALESLYGSVPLDYSSPDVVEAQFDELRREARMCENRAEQVAAETLIPELYHDYLKTLDDLAELLRDLHHIDRVGSRATAKQGVSSVGKGVTAGAATYQVMQQFEYSGDDSTGAALAVGVISIAVDALLNADERQEAEQAEKRQAIDRYKQSYQATAARAEDAAAAMTAKYGWKRGEAGLEFDEQQTAKVLTWLAEGDFKAVQAHAERLSTIRPRDPFVRLARHVFAADAPEASVESLTAAAHGCMDAARLIPGAEVYDEWRLMCVCYAASLAVDAREKERLEAVYAPAKTATSQLAVDLCSIAVQLDPVDSDGGIRELRMLALLANGDVQEAWELANSLIQKRKTTPEYLYFMARVESRRKNAAEAIASLAAAMRAGAWDISIVHREPDLQWLRTHAADEYAELLRPKWTWVADEGWLYDDTLVANNSEFPLTGVVVNLSLKSNGQTHNVELKADSILAGQQYRWPYAIAATSGPWDGESTVDLRCRQAP